MKKFIEYFIDNSLIVNLISVALIIAGLMFVLTANREAFPKVDFGWVLIETAYPGATASDVEKLISIPIEDELREVTGGVKNVSSSSVESYSVVAVELDADVVNKQKLIQDIKDAVDKVPDLPDDAEEPEITELNTREYPVIRISLITKEGMDTYQEEIEMRRYVKMLEDRLINVGGAAQIEEIGYREKEMHVEVDLEKLDRFHVALNDITDALSNKNINFPGGIAKENNEDVMIRTIGEFETAEEIERTVIRANDIGEIVTVGDVANVKPTFEEQDVINKVNGQKSITLTVMIKENYDIITLVDDVKKIVNDYKKDLPEKYSVVLSDDVSYYVKRRLDVLKGNGLVGLILVVLSLFIALGWRIALVSAIGLPIAFAGTFWMMGAQGVSINLISMFGLIMVLGMLVDDAIIVAENIYRHLEHGEELKSAVINGTTEVIIPVAGTIMTTIAAFAPMLFMGGIMGKFMWSLPAVVSIALTMSWLESMLILPSHIYDVERYSKNWGRSLLKMLGFLPFVNPVKDSPEEEEKNTVQKRRPQKMDEVKHSRFRIRRTYVAALAVVLRNKITFLFAISIMFIVTVIFAVKV
ncbi:MAG: efflux RND transporter permease subunit, partial [Spirochaetota bacterium]